jgi:transcriptional regulator with XRE-family HTH domain
MNDMSLAAARLLAAARAQAGLSQRELAARAGTTQSAVARIEGGGTSPTVATLARLVAAAGAELRLELASAPLPNALIEAYKRDVDRSLLRENLKKAPDARLRALTSLAKFAQEAQRAGRAARRQRRRA